MRVGVYVDGYNLYYGGKAQLGAAQGWKWIDVRSLASTLVSDQRSWPQAQISRIVYCTARIDQNRNPSGHHEQDAYLKALRAHGSVDHIEYGKYVTGVRMRPLAVKDAGGSVQLVTSRWPVMVQSTLGTPVPDAHFMVSTLHQEEKGSDVNVATHLLTDVFTGNIDAAVVTSNDSDLKLPVRTVRDRVPLGMVNPRGGRTAGDLTGAATDGVGQHWWRRLGPGDFTAHQMPGIVGRYTRPAAW